GTQLAWKLRGSIAAGLLSAGDRLPGVRELALSAGVNVNTVRSVYGRLAEQGLIVAEHGRGTVVSPAVRAEVELGRLAERPAREATADALAARAGERRHRIAEAQRRHRRWQLEEVPRASSVPDHPPELIVNAGTWTLRWKA